MTAATSEKLAVELDKLGLTEMAARARADHYHDYLSPLDFPELTLVQDLQNAAEVAIEPGRKSKIYALRNLCISGEFDASAEESDAWAASPEGQETLAEFFGGKAKK